MDVDLYYHPLSESDTGGFAAWCRLHAKDKAPKLAAGHALWLDSEGLALISATYAKPFRLTSEMLDERVRGRSLLAKACGVSRYKPSVLDPFVGFGLDALLLAHLGCSVTGLERHPLVWLMFREFAEKSGLMVATHCADALAWLRDENKTWDVVYLDPMFGPRNKGALPNRGLQHLRNLAADYTVDLDGCLHLAQSRAKQRVVLKRRLKDPVFGRPAHQIRGHAIRFDVYL